MLAGCSNCRNRITRARNESGRQSANLIDFERSLISSMENCGSAARNAVVNTLVSMTVCLVQTKSINALDRNHGLNLLGDCAVGARTQERP